MKKLERKIINTVYTFETKKTVLELILRISSIIIVGFCGILLLVSILRQLIEQQTLDMLQLFKEDGEIIKEYIGDVINTLYEELPKHDVLILIILSVTLLLLVLFFIKNSGKIKNKIRSLRRYWKRY